MKTTLALILALAAALSLAASAHAKGGTKATIWGASGSVAIDDPAQMRLLPGYGRRLTAAPKLAPFYTIHLRVDFVPPQHVLLLWVPSARRVAGVGVVSGLEWFPVEAARARMLDAALTNSDPYQPRGAWPPGLESVEQISALAGVTVARPGPADDFPWTYVLSGLAAVGVLCAACLLLVRRRRSAGTANPRPA